ncbi:MAG: class I SAM-dependent methyltransferase [Anaerolineales bacterium]|nr:MAG: class I SAM-dependent methyltransferase [Anaerolineales bacterium]
MLVDTTVKTDMDQIEILSVSLLNTHRALVEEMRRIGDELHIGLGWHYLLDLNWAAHMLQHNPGQHVMDAGAGTGVMQWWLAAQGINVLSVDRSDRANLDLRFRAWCPLQGLRPGDLQPLPRPGLREFLPPRRPWQWHRWPGNLYHALSIAMAKEPRPPHHRGTVTICNQDLANIFDIPDASVDAVVSISALEHNEPDGLRCVVKELMRVIKPGGKLVATLGAAKEKDWFHEPSKGWCYTEATLRDIFDLPADCSSNYDQYDELFEMLRDCAELRENLADFYFKSDENGMPWGIWDPKYQSVGVVKTKRYG